MSSAPDSRENTAVPDGGILFGSLFAQAAVGIAVASPEGRFVRANAALCRMLGFSEQELLQKSVRDITHPEDLESNQELRGDLLSGKAQSRTYEKRYLRKDGSPIWVQIVATAVRDKLGSLHCIVALVYDLTELKLAQDALVEHRAGLTEELDPERL